nr:uncharacterized protein CI109_004773 [Kwoniella shandongensis]KAA5526773.1 hypothetical protein CI109_004773 [Kwoniella shandongensis]
MTISIDSPLPSGRTTPTLPTTTKPFQRTPLPLPYDLLHIILTLLHSSESFGTLSVLSQVSKSYYSLITPMIYTNVHITSDEQLQQLLSLPSDKFRLFGGGGVGGNKRGRSGSIIKRGRKLEALSMIASLKLDIYPSRTSLKLASKLPTPLPAQQVTFTPLGVYSLYDKLSRSQAPRILASFWASHLPSLVKPKKVIVDYSTIDIRKEMLEVNETETEAEQQENGGRGRREGWWDTFGGLSVGLQAWKELEEVDVKGEVWSLILPNPGVKVKMIHTTCTEPQGGVEPPSTLEPTVDLAGGAGEQEPVQVGTPEQPDAAATVALADQRRLWREKLLEDRRKALVSGLQTSYTLLEQTLATTRGRNGMITSTHIRNHPFKWEIVNFFPLPLEGSRNQDELELLVERETEKYEMKRGIMADLDQSCPDLMKAFGKMEGGRRELGCLTWS